MLSHGFRVRFKIFWWAVGRGSALYMGYIKGIHAGNQVKVKIIAKDTVKSFYLVNFKTDGPVYP